LRRPKPPEVDSRGVDVSSSTIRRIARHLRPQAGLSAAVFALLVAGALLNLLPPLLVKRVVDEAIPRADLRQLALLSALMIAAPLAAGLLGVLQKYLSALIGERVTFDLRVRLFKHLHRQPLGYFASARPGETLSRVLNDVEGVGQAVSKTLAAVLKNAVVLASAVAAVIWLDWRLAVVSLCLLPLFVAPARRVGRRRKALKRLAQERMAELTGMLSETLSISGVLLVKTFGAEKLERRRVKKKCRELMRLSLEQTLVGRWFSMLLGLFESVGPALIFLAGGWLVIRGHAQLGTLVAFVTLLRRLYGPASELASVHVDLVTSYAYFERVYAVLDLTPAIRDAPDAVKLAEVRGEIEIRGVSFEYRPGIPALVDVSLSIPAGSTLALVGPSGSGKSTLAALLARLWEPTRGAVLLDGHDLRSLELKSLRARIGVVTQETYLFHATIAENLRYGRPDATGAEVVAAARAAQIDDFIAALPQGYDTLVGERGLRLSGGERQRIAIARALLKDPRILVLDEATSALDAASEALVQAALVPLMKGRTTLIIAHRLSTIRSADAIAVLERGRLREVGSFDELLGKPGLFAELWHRQFQKAA
jgi:ATP-binding cassette, subfamily B, bacterial